MGLIGDRLRTCQRSRRLPPDRGLNLSTCPSPRRSWRNAGTLLRSASFVRPDRNVLRTAMRRHRVIGPSRFP